MSKILTTAVCIFSISTLVFAFFVANQCSLGIKYTSVTLKSSKFKDTSKRKECGTFEQNLTTPRKLWVAFGTDLESLQYAGSAPLSAYIWNHHLNISPIIFVIGNVTQPSSKILVNAMKDAGAAVEIIEPVQNHSKPTLAQVVRMGAYSLPYVSDADYIITSDADIWPMSKAFWRNMFNYSAHFTIVNGEFFRGGVGGEVGIAMCYVGAHAKAWQALLEQSANAFPEIVAPLQPLMCEGENTTSVRTPREIAMLLLDAGKTFRKEKWSNTAKGGDQWYWDQIFITYAFRHAVKKFNVSYHLGAGLGSRRLDRSGWRFSGDIEKHTDAHLIYPVSNENVKKSLLEVWKVMFNNSWAETYLTAYVKSLQQHH